MENKQKELIDDFSLFDDWEGKYSYLIDIGKNLPNMPKDEKIEENIVKGCVSQVWMILTIKDNKIHLKADSDAQIVRGLIALLIKIYDGLDICEIKNINMNDIFSQIGLDKHLSPNRRNGFFAMVEKIQNLTGGRT